MFINFPFVIQICKPIVFTKSNYMSNFTGDFFNIRAILISPNARKQQITWPQN